MQRIALNAFGSDAGTASFLRLFEHDEAWVRLVAAALALRIRNRESLDVLNSLASSGDRAVAFDAKLCIRAWKSGEWALDIPIEPLHTVKGKPVEVAIEGEPYIRLRELAFYVPIREVLDAGDLYVRIGLVDIYFVNIIGVNKGSVSFCPNLDPVSDDERIAWAFVVFPTLAKALIERIGDSNFKTALADFFRQTE